MWTLTTPIPSPDVAVMRAYSVNMNADNAVVRICVEDNAGLSWGQDFSLSIRNGTSEGIRANTSPPGNFQQILETFPVATATGYDDLVTACVGATFADQLLAVEAYMGGAGLMPPGS